MSGDGRVPRGREAFRFFLAVLFTALSLPAPAQTMDTNSLRAAENYRWGVKAYDTGYYNNAIEYFEKALSFKPENVNERVWLGKALYKSGMEEAALHEWNLVLGKGKGTPLLDNFVQVVRSRQGLWPDIGDEGKTVVSNVIDASSLTAQKFKRPSSARSRKDGTLAIVSFATNQIFYLDSNNLLLSTFSGGLEGLQNPFDFLESGNDSFFISEYTGNQISKFDNAGNKLAVFGSGGTGPGQLLGPQYMAMDHSGYLYVSDWGNKRVNKYTVEGEFVFSIGGKGSASPVLSGPTGIAIRGDQVFVADRLKKQIACFDRDGNLLKLYGEGMLDGPEGLLLYNPDSLLIADTAAFAEKTRILELGIGQENLRTVIDLSKTAKRILNLSLSPNGEIIAADYDRNKVLGLSDINGLFTSLCVQVETLDAEKYPEITMDISVEDRAGNPVIGLKEDNFRITESFKPTGSPTLYRPLNASENFDCVVVVEKSVSMEEQKENIKKALAAIIDGAGTDSAVYLVTASGQAVIEALPQDTKLKKIESAFNAAITTEVRADSALRLAAARLIPSRRKRIVCYLTTGAEKNLLFRDYSLMDTSNYLRNNHVGFYPLYFSQGEKNDDLEYIREKTGAKSFVYFDKQGMLPVLPAFRAQKDPRYVVRFNSVTFNDLGKNPIQVEAEVTLHRKTGRDESAYYGPIIDTSKPK
jgi:hypothetical protein